MGWLPFDMSTPPAITFLLQDVPALYGAERVTLSLLSGLRDRGVDLQVLLIGEARLGPEPAALARAVAAAGLPAERLVVAGRFSRELVRDLHHRLKRHRGSIIHTVGYKAHLHALIASRGVVPSVTTIHGWLVRRELKERLYEWIEVQALRHDEAVICLTSYYEQLLLQRGVRRARLHRIPTGLEEDAFPPRPQAMPQPDGPFTLALVGRFSSEKNHALLVRALARLARQRVTFRAILAGEGPDKAAVQQQVADLGLSDRVEFPGYADMAQLLPRVHAVTLCSRIENLPLSLLEAMAWGRPVVATRVGGVPDVVVDDVTGFLVPSDDESALAERLRQLAQSPPLRARLGEAGRQRVEREFVHRVCVDRHLELYARLQAGAR